VKSNEGSKCNNDNCPYRLRVRCERFQLWGAGAVRYVPEANGNGTYWCDAFDLKKED